MSALAIHPLTPSRWADLEAVFAARGCSQARGCWCMYYRRSGARAAPPAGVSVAQANKADFKALVDAGHFTGLLAYRGAQPVGWLALAPREDFARLARSPVMKPVDARPVWSLICFVVPAAERGRGVAKALLQGAIEHAAAQGIALLEAYPVDKPGRGADDNLWFGVKSMFDAAGFEEVARRKPERPIVRIRPAG